MPLQNFTVGDFSGGISDFILKSGAEKNETVENLIVDEDNSLISRPGSRYLARPVSRSRIGGIYSDEEFKVFSTGGLLYSFLGGSALPIPSNEGSAPLNVNSDKHITSFSRILYHLYLSSNEYSFPQQVYDSNDAGAFKMTQMGLPLPNVSNVSVVYKTDPEFENVKLILQADADSVKDVSSLGKTLTNSGSSKAGGVYKHYSDLNEGHITTPSAGIEPEGDDFTIESRIRIKAQPAAEGIVFGYWQDAGDNGSLKLTYNGTSLALTTRLSDETLATVSHAVVLKLATWYEICIQRSEGKLSLYLNGERVINGDFTGTLKDVTAVFSIGAGTGGENPLALDIDKFRLTLEVARYEESYKLLPEPWARGGPFLEPSLEYGAPDLAFQYVYNYRASKRLFSQVGPINYVKTKFGLLPSEVSNVVTNGLPILINEGVNNYDLENVELQVFQANFSSETFSLLGKVKVGERSLAGNFTPSHLREQIALLRPLDPPDFDPPPKCKYLHSVGNVMHFANCAKDGEVLEDTIFESFADRPYHVNGVNRIKVQGEIRGIHSIRDNLFIFTDKRVYRKTGFFSESTVPSLVEIDGTSGALSNASIVKVQNKLFWAGPDQIYYTDGESVIGLGGDLLDRYAKNLSNTSDQSHIVGVYDWLEDLVLWTFQADSTRPDFDTLWSLDLRKLSGGGFNADSCFTTWTGSVNSFSPTALAFDKDGLIRGDVQGYLFRHNKELSSDPIIGPEDPSEWFEAPVVERFKTRTLDFGDRSMRKIFPRLQGSMSGKTSYSLSVSVINDEDGVRRYVDDVFTGIGGWIWGDPDTDWLNSPLSFGAVRFERFSRYLPKGRLRANVFQLIFERSKTELLDSAFGLGDGNIINNRAIYLNSGEFPVLLTGYDNLDISFSTDDYKARFPLISKANNFLNFDNLGVVFDSPENVSFRVYGYKLGQKIKLDDYSIFWAPSGVSSLTTSLGDS